MDKTLKWFKREVVPNLLEYDIMFRSYQNGDFGDLEQVLFDSKQKGGVIDFCS